MRTLEGIDTIAREVKSFSIINKLEDMRTLEGIDTIIWQTANDSFRLEDMRTLEGIDTLNHSSGFTFSSYR